MFKFKPILKNFIEIGYRFSYFLFSIFFSSFIFFSFYFEFTLLLTLPTASKLNTFLLLDPREHILFYINYAVFLILLFILPYFYYSLCDFIRPALYRIEKQAFLGNNVNLFLAYIFVNYITWKVGLPLFWDFFMTPEKNFNIINFDAQISANNYLSYITQLFFFTNFLQFFLLIFFFLFAKNLTTIINQKRFILFAFIIFSTLVTPPDIFWQIAIFACLCICLEFFIFWFFLNLFYKNFKMVKS